MGNWRDRPVRRFRRQNNPPPPKEYGPEPLELWQDGIPLWEKKFCVVVGSVPWRKIVDTKKVMYLHSNVTNWDDSAGEEAFRNAKRRYWAEINGMDSSISLPDNDFYVDEIDWNPAVDSELIEDLDRAYFAPEEEEINDKSEDKRKNETSISPISEEQSRNAENAENPWESSMKQGCKLLENSTQKWSTWDDKFANINPWERDFKGDGRITNNAWGDCLKSGRKLSNWDRAGSHGNGGNPFDSHGQTSSYGYSENKRTPREREWSNSEEHSGRWKDRKDEERRGGWEAGQKGYQNEYNYRSSSHQRDDYRTGKCRGRGFIEKRSVFPFDRYYV